MIYLMAMLQAVPAVAITAPVPQDDIVVLGRRLQQVRVHMNLNRRGELLRCEVSKSVGDPALDRFWCDAGQACAQEIGRGGKRRAMQACMEGRREEFLKMLAATRAAHSKEAHSNAQN